MITVMGNAHGMQLVKEAAYEMQSAMGEGIKMKCVSKASKE